MFYYPVVMRQHFRAIGMHSHHFSSILPMSCGTVGSQGVGIGVSQPHIIVDFTTGFTKLTPK